MTLKKLGILFTSFAVSLCFSQEIDNNTEDNKILFLQLKSINFQAGKQIINIQNSKNLKNIKQVVSEKEFEKTPNKKLMKKYSKELSLLSSIYLNNIMKKNAGFIALYKANQIFLNNFAYLTDKKMKLYINQITTTKYENTPLSGKAIKIGWTISKEEKGNTKQKINTYQKLNQTLQIKKRNNQYSQEKYYGYCTFENTIKVYVKPINAKTICLLENKEGKTLKGYLYGKLVPDLQNKALYFQPIFFETENGKPLKVKPLLVMTADKKTNNIANVVNERVLEKVLANASSQSLEDIKEAIKQKYGEGETENIYVSGDLVVQKRNNSLINIGNLAFKDFLTTVAEEFANIAKQNLQNIPTIFTVEQGQTIYVELLITNY